MGIAALIQQWKNRGYDYAQGLRIYEKHGPNPALLKVLQKGKSPGNQILLQAQLDKLAAMPIAEPARETPPNAPPRKTKQSGRHNDPVIKQLDLHWKPLFKKANAMHAQLDHLRSQQKLTETALEIRRLFDEEIEPIWAKKDYYLEHGILPPTKQDTPLDRMSVAEIYTLIKRLPSKISKHKKWLKGDDEQKAIERLDKIKAMEAELVAAKAKLEGAHDTFI